MTDARELRLLVGFSAGSVSNIVAQLLAPALAERLGHPVRIVQSPGANGANAAEQLARAVPDGLTLGMCVPTYLVGSLIGEAPRYDPLSDFAAVTMIARNPLVLAVSNQLGVDSVGALIQLARASVPSLAYGASALGGGPHLAAVLFESMAGLRLQRRVYAETHALLADLARGALALTFNNPTTVLAQSRAGNLRMLAVTSRAASALVPGVPSIARSGLAEFEFMSWVGLVAPAGTPAPILDRLAQCAQHAIASRAMTDGLHALGCEPVHESMPWFAHHLRTEAVRWRDFTAVHPHAFPGLRAPLD